jgi:hypothetical protein
MVAIVLRRDDVCGLERAVHLLRNSLHSAVTYADFAGNLEDALTGPQLRLDGPY